jgi:hypothetical protein
MPQSEAQKEGGAFHIFLKKVASDCLSGGETHTHTRTLEFHARTGPIAATTGRNNLETACLAHGQRLTGLPHKKKIHTAHTHTNAHTH